MNSIWATNSGSRQNTDDDNRGLVLIDGEISSILAFVFPALSNHFVRPRQHVWRNRRAIYLAAFKLMSSSNFVAAPGLFFWTIVINLRHHVDHLVVEAFLGCYLDRGVLLQLQRLQPRR